MSIIAAPPDVLRWSPRSQGHGDCAVAALELACGVTYEVALAAAISTNPHTLTSGMTWAAIRKAAQFLGFTTSLKQYYNLEEDTGILNVWQARHKPTSDHVVFLWEGRIIEPRYDRRQLWLDAAQYITHYKYTAGGLLIMTQLTAR